MRIVVVRHGEPNYERDCLTPLGELQAKAAAERLMEEHIDRVCTSPMGRARQTAGAFCERSGIGDPQILDFMHEICWGSVDGNPIFENGHPWAISDEMTRLGMDLRDEGWRTNRFYENNTAVGAADRVAAETDKWMRSLGYEREGLYYRCLGGEDTRRTIALFCHGGSSTAMFAQLLNLTFPYLCATVHMSFTGITILRLDSRPGSLSIPVLELVSDGRHIEGVKLSGD